MQRSKWIRLPYHEKRAMWMKIKHQMKSQSKRIDGMLHNSQIVNVTWPLAMLKKFELEKGAELKIAEDPELTQVEKIYFSHAGRKANGV